MIFFFIKSLKFLPDSNVETTKYREENFLRMMRVCLVTSEASIGEPNEYTNGQEAANQAVDGGEKAGGCVATKNVNVDLLKDVHGTCINLR